MSESDRIQGINAVFASEAMQVQISSWKEQELLMRQTVTELWESGDFSLWWKELRKDAKMALIMTALEDLPQNSSFGSLIFVASPELKDSPTLFNEDQRLIDLLSQVAASKENNDDVFSFSTYLEEFSSSNVSPSPATEKAMKLARSCILLQFATDILLVYNDQRDEDSLKSSEP